MKIQWKHFVYPALVVVVGGGIGTFMMQTRSSSFAFASGGPADPLAGAPTVSTMMLTSASYAPQLQLYSQLKSAQEVILTSPFNAEVLSVNVFEGDRVEAGEVLMQLDASALQRQVTQLEAQRENLLATWQIDAQQHENDERALAVERNLVGIAERSVNRLQNLSAQNLSSSAELEDAERTLQNQILTLQNRELAVARFELVEKQYQAQLRELDSQLDDAREQLAEADVTAPFAGTVASINVQVGATPASGSQMMTLVDEAQQELVAWAAVSALDAAGNLDQLAGLMSVAEQEFPVMLSHRDPAADAGSLQLYFVPQGETPELTLNRYYRLYVDMPQQTAFAVPESAVYSNRFVYAVSENQLNRIDVEVIGQRYQDGQLWRLVNGPLQGEEVLVTRLQDVAQGRLVRDAEQLPQLAAAGE